MKFPSYPRYKDSGIDWLGKVPEHWRVKKFKYLFKPSDERNGESIVGEMLSVSGYRGIVIKAYEDENQKRTEENLRDYRVVRPGQLVVNTMWLNYAGLGVSRYEGYVSPAYRAYYISEEINDWFAHHLLRSSIYVSGYTKYLQGIRPNSLQIKSEEFHSFPILLPPAEEQAVIANFLDRETNKIDTLIAKQERHIAFLQEKLQAQISYAVTKGLNPSALYKGSGIAWVGEIPEHWRMIKLKWIFETTSGGTPNTNLHERYYNGKIPWLRTLDLNNATIDKAEIYITEHAIRDTACKVLPVNSVLVAMYGGEGTIGKNGILRIESTINQAICAILPNKNYCSEYLHYFIKFYRPFWMITAEGTRKDPNISQDQVRDIKIPLLPIAEQRDISEYLDRATSKINALIKKAQRAIELLQEHRTVLISSVVTGKIDVRQNRNGDLSDH